LRKARVDRLHGQIDDAALEAIEDEAIVDVLKMQRNAGIQIYSDGEFRRAFWLSAISDKFFHGFEDRGIDYARYPTLVGKSIADREEFVPQVPVVVDKLKAKGRITGDEIQFLKKHSPGPFKITMPSATQFPAISFKYGVTDAVYKDPYAMLDAITTIMVNDIGETVKSGVSYLQIDAPRYSYYLDPKWIDWMQKELRVDSDRMLTASLDADNKCFAAARQPGITVAIHLCRGNNRSHWYAEGGYDAIADRLFNELQVDRFLLEYDDERSGTFEPLRFVPKGKTVVLGLVSSKRAELENKNDLLAKVDQASKVIPLEQLAISPQCGFASTMEGNLLTEDDQWAKLQLVCEVAREVWG